MMAWDEVKKIARRFHNRSGNTLFGVYVFLPLT